MYKLFTDKSELFECDIKIEGAQLSNSIARLVVETADYSLMFNGKISSNGKCQIPIRKLKGLIDESSNGNIRLEVIADDTYFTPWKSDFAIEASKKVTVEVRSQNKQVIRENKVQISNISQEITSQEVGHVTNILKLLVRENITLENLSVKKNRLNKIVATYRKHKPLTENKHKEVIKGVLKGLYKK
tara:strand:+ start:745 stop:1305 length:561 start_codon:yes stop_codon:yes gene_type:complete